MGKAKSAPAKVTTCAPEAAYTVRLADYTPTGTMRETNAGWVNLAADIDTLAQQYDTINIDTVGVFCLRPEASQALVGTLAKHTGVRYIVYNNAKEAKKLCAACAMSCNLDFDAERIVNIVPQAVSQVSAAVVSKNKTLREKFENSLVVSENNSVATLPLYNSVTQVASISTVLIIEELVRDTYKANPQLRQFNIDFGDMMVNQSVSVPLATMCVALRAENMHIAFLNLESAAQVETAAAVECQGMSPALGCKTVKDIMQLPEREAILEKMLPVGTPCFFVSYKNAHALDEYGRNGGGAPFYIRLAVFRGRNRGSGHYMFETWRKADLVTREHKMITEDIYDYELTSIMVSVPLDQLGFDKKFFGTDYFCAPLVDISGTKYVLQTYTDTERKATAPIYCTLPEYAAQVFDSHGIEYDKQAMEECIKQTRKLNNAEAQSVDSAR